MNSKKIETTKEMTLEEMETATRPDVEALIAEDQRLDSSKNDDSKWDASSTGALALVREAPVPAFDVLTVINDKVAFAVADLHTVLMSEIGKLRAELSQAPALQGELMMAPMRGTIYCPKCGLMLEGGAATSMATTPLLHPFSGSPSLGGRTCDLIGREFEKPKVFIKVLPDKRLKSTVKEPELVEALTA